MEIEEPENKNSINVNKNNIEEEEQSEEKMIEELTNKVDSVFDNMLKNLGQTAKPEHSQGAPPTIPQNIHLEYRKQLVGMTVPQLEKELEKKKKLLGMIRVADAGEKTKNTITFIEEMIKAKKEEGFRKPIGVRVHPETGHEDEFDLKKNQFFDPETDEELQEWASKWNRPLTEKELEEFRKKKKELLQKKRNVNKMQLPSETLMIQGRRNLQYKHEILNNKNSPLKKKFPQLALQSRRAQLLDDDELEKVSKEAEPSIQTFDEVDEIENRLLNEQIQEMSIQNNDEDDEDEE